jgi:hypothetical protein
MKGLVYAEVISDLNFPYRIIIVGNSEARKHCIVPQVNISAGSGRIPIFASPFMVLVSAKAMAALSYAYLGRSSSKYPNYRIVTYNGFETYPPPPSGGILSHGLRYAVQCRKAASHLTLTQGLTHTVPSSFPSSFLNTFRISMEWKCLPCMRGSVWRQMFSAGLQRQARMEVQNRSNFSRGRLDLAGNERKANV